MDAETKKRLEQIACKVRMGIIEGVHAAKSGHPGGSLSCVEMLTYLYFNYMNIDPEAPKDPKRDRFVLSKGHAAPALYSVLAERGYFSPDELLHLRHIGSMLQGHPDMKHIPGIDMSTGSLGQGISAAVGMALSSKHFDTGFNVFTVLGDGEIEEGQVWEAAMFAAHYKLDNLTAFLDFNGLQIDGDIREVMNPTPVDEKFKAFNWNVICIDAHNFEEIENAINEAKNTKGKPTMIIAKSIKGKGVSYMENVAGWHGAAPNDEQYAQAISELDKYIEEVRGGANV